jgi:hypothetical protein
VHFLAKGNKYILQDRKYQESLEYEYEKTDVE